MLNGYGSALQVDTGEMQPDGWQTEHIVQFIMIKLVLITSQLFHISYFGRFYMFIQCLCYSPGSRKPGGWSSTSWKKPKNLSKTFCGIRQLPEDDL